MSVRTCPPDAHSAVLFVLPLHARKELGQHGILDKVHHGSTSIATARDLPEGNDLFPVHGNCITRDMAKSKRPFLEVYPSFELALLRPRHRFSPIDRHDFLVAATQCADF